MKNKKQTKPVLPADPEEQNEDRAEWAREAVLRFQKVTGLGKADGLDTAVMDLLCDLAHLCDREGLELGDQLKRARDHYQEETATEDEDAEPRGKQFDFLPGDWRMGEYQCQNCQLIWKQEALKPMPLEGIFERVAPGEPMPAGECPDCGAVCHEVRR